MVINKSKFYKYNIFSSLNKKLFIKYQKKSLLVPILNNNVK